MSQTVRFGITTKPINSTSRVFYGGSTVDLDCDFIEKCTVENPVFIVKGLTKLNNYNFAMWNNKYYWIDNIEFVTRDIQNVYCHIDPLATYYDDIINDDYYVIYGNSDHWNDWIDDVRFQPEKQHFYTNSTKAFNLFGGSTGWAHPEKAISLNPDGCIMVRVMETLSAPDIDVLHLDASLKAKAPDHQGINTYVLKYSQMKQWISDMSVKLGSFAEAILTTPGLTDIEKLLKVAAKFWGTISGAGSWRDNLLSVVYLPLDYDDVIKYGEKVDYFCCGGIPVGVSTNTATFPIYRMNHQVEIAQFDGAIEIPWATDITANPGQSDLSGKYAFLRNRRWYSLQLYTPGGYCDIDMQELKGQTQLHAWTSLNLYTGEWALRITETGDPGSEVLASFAGCIGVDLTEFVGSADSASNQANNVMNKVAGVIASVALKTDITSASDQLNNINAIPNSMLSDAQKGQKVFAAFEARQQYSNAVTANNIADGIMGTFNPTGIDPSCPSASMAGNIQSMFLTNNFGVCYLIGIQYTTKDIANYSKYCTKHGFPVNAWLNLKNDDVEGYVKCAGAYCDKVMGASPKSLAIINSYLNNGIVIAE